MEYENILIIDVDSNLRETSNDEDFNFSYDFNYMDRNLLEEDREFISIIKSSIPKTYHEINDVNNKLTIIADGISYIFSLVTGNYTKAFFFKDVKIELNEFFVNNNIQCELDIFQEYKSNYDYGLIEMKLMSNSIVEEIELIADDNNTMCDLFFGLIFEELFTVYHNEITVTPKEINMNSESNFVVCTDLIENKYEVKRTYEYPKLCEVDMEETPYHSTNIENYDVEMYKKDINIKTYSTFELQVEISSIENVFYDIQGEVKLELVLFNYGIPREELFMLERDIMILEEEIHKKQENDKLHEEIQEEMKNIEFEYQMLEEKQIQF